MGCFEWGAFSLAIFIQVGFHIFFAVSAWEPPPSMMQICEVRDRDLAQCISKAAQSHTVCMWCAQESSCVGVPCGSNFSSFVPRCGSIEFNNNHCDHPATSATVSRLWETWLLIFEFSIVSCLVAAFMTYSPKKKRWHQYCEAGFLCLVVVGGVLFTSLILLHDSDFPPSMGLLVASIPLFLFLARFLYSTQEDLRPCCPLLLMLLSGALTALRVTVADLAHAWLVFVALGVGSFFCCSLICAQETRDRILVPLGCLPLQITRGDRLSVAAWLATLVATLFWDGLRTSCATLHVAMAVLLQVLFMRHEVGSVCLKVLIGLFFCAELVAWVVTFAFEVCPGECGDTSMAALVSLSFGLAAGLCFLAHLCHMNVHNDYFEFHLYHIRGVNSKCLWDLLPEAAALIEAYARDPPPDEGEEFLMDGEEPGTRVLFLYQVE